MDEQDLTHTLYTPWIECLRASEARYRIISELMSDYAYAFRVAPEGSLQCEWVTDAFERITGYTPEMLLQAGGYEKLIHPEDVPISQRRTQALLRGEPDTSEFRIITRDGQVRWVRDSARPELDGSGQVVRLYGAAQDITERRKAEEQLRKNECRLRRSEERLRRLAARIETALEAERARISRKIHDELGQTLTALRFDVHWLKARLKRSSPEVQAKLDAMLAHIDEAIRQVQQIASELRPQLLDDLGLPAAIEWSVKQFAERTGLEYALTIEPEEVAIPPACATDLYRILQEALTNVARHAQATRVEVRLAKEGDGLTLTLRDNGRGITPKEMKNPNALGIIGMRERAARWDGQLVIAGEPGKGTVVSVHIPTRGE